MKEVFVMKQYQENVKWLTYFTPFRSMSISVAYLAPFFLENGLSMSEILILQSIFSIVVLLWELPSGYIADKLGRAFCIKISAPIAAIAMITYGLSHRYWQFVVCELALAIATGLLSGVDTALLIDSLNASNRGKEYKKISQRLNALEFTAIALGVPIAMVIIYYLGIGSTIVADGILTLIASFFAFKLVEAPYSKDDNPKTTRLSTWDSIKQLRLNTEFLWLIVLSSTLSVSTYLGFWLSTPYYEKLGISVIWFGVILAIRSLWKAWLSHRFTQEKHVELNMLSYALLAGLVYLAMASNSLWLIWLVLGHDIVQALGKQPIIDKLNDHFDQESRATMNSLVNLIQRLVYSIAGPLVGLMIDKTSLSKSFMIIGVIFSAVALISLVRLRKLGTFKDKK